MSAPHLTLVTDTPTVDQVTHQILHDHSRTVTGISAAWERLVPGCTITITFITGATSVLTGFDTQLAGLLHAQRVLREAKTMRESRA